MKKFYGFAALILIMAMMLSSCSLNSGSSGGMLNGEGSGSGNTIGGNTSVNKPGNDSEKTEALPLPEGAFMNVEKPAVIGSIVQTGDGNAYVNGVVPGGNASIQASAGNAYISGNILTIQSLSVSEQFNVKQMASIDKTLVTMEHSYGYSCYVSGYIGNSLYIIQDHGSLGWNKKGIGHKDGKILLEYGEKGYFSISTLSENKVIVGNPTDEAVESLWDNSDSYLFGYMVYDETTKEIKPMYEDNNLRFYTAGYFSDGVATVSVKKDDKILFGVIDAKGDYVIEPTYEIMGDESVNGIAIVGLDADAVSDEYYTGDTCGRNIGYDSTLMTNIQFKRGYRCTSQTVGLVNVTTGESILNTEYAYIERVYDNTYFVVGNDGAKFLYDTATGTRTEVESGFYTYFNTEWMLYVSEEGEIFLADKELVLYDATEFDFRGGLNETIGDVKKLINTNKISAICDKNADFVTSGDRSHSEFNDEFDPETRTHNITVGATGDVINNVNSYTQPYNGGFLYTKDNSLYRYDMQTGASVKIETGYGNFTKDYENQGRSFYTSVSALDDGVYLVRYNVELADGSTYFMIIVNDMGVVLYNAAINSVERLTQNYLGKYDDALHALAGSTAVEDNYLLTRDDGSHFLISFVRGELEEGSTEGEDALKTTRTLDNLSTISYLSPFVLDFASGSEISVIIGDVILTSEHYVYLSEEQSLKMLPSAFDFTIHEQMREDGYLEIVVSAGGESAILRLEVSPFAFRF